METSYMFTSDDVYSILRQEILTFAIEPGALMSENAVSARFNTSRTPTRSAFEWLRKDGLIDVIPKKGTFVSLIDLDFAEQMIYMRIHSELAAMTQIARMPSHDLFALLRDNLAAQRCLIEQGVIREEFYRLDSRFHELCMQAVGKHKLWQVIQDINVHYSRYRHMDYRLSNQQDIYASLYQDHENIFHALETRDVPLLKYLLTTHLYSGFLRIGTKLTTEYSHYFVDTGRSINEILMDIKMLIQASRDEMPDPKKK